MKKAILLILIVLVITVGVYLLKPKETPKKEEKIIPKINEKLTEDQVIDNILISNISLTNKNNKAIFSAKITNLTANELIYKNLQINIKDKNNKELTTLITYFGETLNPEETKIVTAETNKEIKDADSLEFILNK